VEWEEEERRSKDKVKETEVKSRLGIEKRMVI